MASTAACERLVNDERRRRLLELGDELHGLLPATFAGSLEAAGVAVGAA